MLNKGNLRFPLFNKRILDKKHKEKISEYKNKMRWYEICETGQRNK
jgi:hypothetical protein